MTRDLQPLGQTACEYLTALDGTGYDVCVRSDAPFDLRAPRGARCEWSCSDARTFSEILGDFFASEDGAGVRRELEDPPALLFDGDVVETGGAAPAETDARCLNSRSCEWTIHPT